MRKAARVTRGRFRLALTLGLPLALTVGQPPAHAQDGKPPAPDNATPAPDGPGLAPGNATEADKLFDEGRRLMMQPGQLDAACDTLTKSLALMVRGDTYLNLAECHRRQGKTATAWREFGEALNHAESVQFKEAIETAKGIRAELGAKLSSLTVQVPDAAAALTGFTIKLNGEPFPRERWGQAMVLDPQSYRVEAGAERHQPFATTVELGSESDKKQVVVALEPVPPPPPKPAPAPPPPPVPKIAQPPSSGGIHPVAIIGFAVGGAGFITYAITGGLGLGQRSDFDDRCPNDLCPAGSEGDIDDAILLSDIATVGLATGVLGAGVGAFGLFFLDTDDDGADSALTLDVGPGSATLRARF